MPARFVAWESVPAHGAEHHPAKDGGARSSSDVRGAAGHPPQDGEQAGKEAGGGFVPSCGRPRSGASSCPKMQRPVGPCAPTRCGGHPDSPDRHLHGSWRCTGGRTAPAVMRQLDVFPRRGGPAAPRRDGPCGRRCTGRAGAAPRIRASGPTAACGPVREIPLRPVRRARPSACPGRRRAWRRPRPPGARRSAGSGDGNG